MLWKFLITIAILGAGLLVAQESAETEEQRKQDLEQFEQRKQEQATPMDDGDCPCRPGGCC